MAGKMRSFRFDDDAAWSAAQVRARAESRAFGDALGDMIRAYAAGDAVAMAAAYSDAVMTTARETGQPVMTNPVPEPPVMTPEPVLAAPVMTAPEPSKPPAARSGRYACCKHCRVGHAGHADPCTQGCG